nr:MAG TPA: hypothetical protein [Caudoviricetes sp.]
MYSNRLLMSLFFNLKNSLTYTIKSYIIKM